MIVQFHLHIYNNNIIITFNKNIHHKYFQHSFFSNTVTLRKEDLDLEMELILSNSFRKSP